MIPFPAHNTQFLLDGPAGKLQAMVEFPPGVTADTPVAVICHPHPPDGGSMHNKVVSTLAKAFLDCAYIALRFNFRGVGESEGEYDAGHGELADCLAVLAWLKQARPDAALALSGFSFGAWVALKAAEQVPPGRMVTIAPPVGFRDFATVRPPSCPWLAIQGEADEIVSAQNVLAWLNAQDPAPDVVLMADTGHFFHGRLIALREQVKGFLRATALSPW